MALDLKLKVFNIYSDNGKFPSVDLVDNTGDYDAITNPGGYGGGNATRESLNIHVYGYKQNVESDDQQVEIPNPVPTTASLWNAELIGDGHYLYNIIGSEEWVDGLTFDLDQVIYFDGLFYKSTVSHLAASSNAPDQGTAEWEEVTEEFFRTIVYDDPDTYGVHVGSLDWVYTNLADVHYVNILSKLSKKGCGCNCSKACKQHLDQFDFFLNATVALFYQENFTEAAKAVLVLDDMRTRNDCTECQ